MLKSPTLQFNHECEQIVNVLTPILAVGFGAHCVIAYQESQ